MLSLLFIYEKAVSDVGI